MSKFLSQGDKKGLMLSNQKTIAGLLEQMKSEIARCLPKHLTPERMARIALTELRKTPKLQECEPLSFIAAIMQASQLGLEPGVLGACYLIPFFNGKTGKTECNFIPGYRGFLDLARRSGQIISLTAHSVFENDEFIYEYGLEEKLVHRPTLNDKGSLVAVYSVARLKDGGYQFEVMSKKEVDEIRQQSKSGNAGPWVTHYEQMAKKTILRKLFKWLPCSIEMQKAVVLDEHADVGIQDIKASASEEFDMDFSEHVVIDNDTGEVFSQKKSDPLIDKLDKIITEITPQLINLDQITIINDKLSEKKINKKQLDEILKNRGISSIEEIKSSDFNEFVNSI